MLFLDFFYLGSKFSLGDKLCHGMIASSTPGIFILADIAILFQS